MSKCLTCKWSTGPWTVETYQEIAGVFKFGTVQIQSPTPTLAIWSETEQEAVFQPQHVNYTITALVQSYPWATDSFSSNKTEISINKNSIMEAEVNDDHHQCTLMWATSNIHNWLLQDPLDLCLTIHAHISKQCYLMWFSIIFYTFLPLMQPICSTHLNLLDLLAPSYELMGKLWSSPIMQFLHILYAFLHQTHPTHSNHLIILDLIILLYQLWVKIMTLPNMQFLHSFWYSHQNFFLEFPQNGSPGYIPTSNDI